MLNFILAGFVWFGTLYVSNDPGGPIWERINQIDQLEVDGTRVVIGGYCNSACTLYFNLDKSKVCMRPGTTFKFHAPRTQNGQGPISEVGKSFMMQMYPKPLQDWIKARGGLGYDIITLSHEEAKKFMRVCG